MTQATASSSGSGGSREGLADTGGDDSEAVGRHRGGVAGSWPLGLR